MVGVWQPLFAQSGKEKPPASGSQEAGKKGLRFRSTWGIFLSETLSKTEIVKLLDSVLVVRDQQNNKFPVVSFKFTYENVEPYLNDSTGRPDVYREYIGDNFKSDRLSPLWSTRMKDMVKSGDVLFFDDIIIRYTGDKYYRAPSLKFQVK